MSLLAPLYFIGALAIGAPILFHMIRRQPKGQVEFSSLMFLRPTPPRLTRRSRLDNWFLLLLRALALMLLAAAFARPFLRSVTLSEAEVPGRRLVIVVDRSASMQRNGLWEQVLDQADEVLADLQPADQLAVVAFDQQPQLLLGFDESGKLAPGQLKVTVHELLEETKPTWLKSELGSALAFAGDLAVNYESEDRVVVANDATAEDINATAEDIEGNAAADQSATVEDAHLILISDMASGSERESLQTYAWPKSLRLDVRRVASSQRTNAFAQVMEADAESAGEVDRVRVRVSNSQDANESQFSIRWSGGAGVAEPTTSVELPVQVPPGQSRVVRMPMPGPGMTSLVLQGDDHSFDNTRYRVRPEPQPYTLLHLGKVAGEPRDSLLFYLQRIPFDNQRRIVSVETLDPEQLSEVPDPLTVPLIVVTEELPEPVAMRLVEYAEAGGRVLVVLWKQPEAAGFGATINRIAGSDLEFSEAEVDDYAMLSRIDFSHPLFRTMSDPQFNDFSKIRYWAHRTINNVEPDWIIVARYDDGDPAVLEKNLGEGRLFVMASGWQPNESQLALSTKFIPLLFSFLDSGQTGATAERYTVGQSIDFPPSDEASITGPAGSAFQYSEQTDRDGIDQPGVYQFSDGNQARSFAVNLDESESRTDPFDEEALTRFGVVLGKNVTTAQALEGKRQLRDRELESQQRLWQWLLVLALALLGLETVLGTLWSRSGRATDAAVVEAG